MNNVASLQRKHLLFERSLFLEEVVELVDRLSPTCEFELSSEGKLAILPRRPMASGLEHLDDTRLDDNPAKNSQPN
jgi:hypothetical protein